MGQLNIKLTKEINTNSDKVWNVIGPNFVDVSKWARGVEKSWSNDSIEKEFADAPVAGRRCEVKGFGELDERIIHYDVSNQEITWSAAGKKLPGFVKNLQNALSVNDNKDGTSTVTTNITADLNGVMGFLMKPMMKKNFSKLLEGFLHDWKAYAETGEVSTVKQKELKK